MFANAIQANPDKGGSLAAAVPPPNKTWMFWMCIIGPLVFFFISLSLNSLCFGIMVVKSQCTFTSPLNLLMMVFLLTMAYYSLNNIVCSILKEALCLDTGDVFNRLNMTGDLFSNYFSIVLIFLIGLHRCATYTMPWMIKHFFQRKQLLIILAILACLTAGMATSVFSTTGMKMEMGDEGYTEIVVSNMTLLKIFAYGGYAIALSSCLFYVRVFFYLREQRIGATHNKTKELLNKAENFNTRQGIFVLLIYSISLVLFIIAESVEPGSSEMILHALSQIVQALPSLAIPVSLLCFCEEMQSVLIYFLTGGKKGYRCKHAHEFSVSTSGMNYSRRATMSGTSKPTLA